MKSIRKSDIFLGGKASEWSPFLSKLSWGFYKGKIAFDSTQMLRKIALVLNLLLNTILNNKSSIWIIDNNGKYRHFVNKYHKELSKINVYYTGEMLPGGFLTNKLHFEKGEYKYPQIVLFSFISVTQNQFVKDLQNKGVICIGCSSNWVKSLDYSLYSNNSEKTNVLFYFIISFLVFVSKYKKYLTHKKIKLTKNFTKKNEKIKL